MPSYQVILGILQNISLQYSTNVIIHPSKMPLWPKFASRRTWNCTLCPKRLLSAAGLHKHQQVHLPAPTRTCTMCGLQTRWAQSLSRHILRMHTSWFSIYWALSHDLAVVINCLFSNTAHITESAQAGVLRVAKRKRAAAKKKTPTKTTPHVHLPPMPQDTSIASGCPGVYARALVCTGVQMPQLEICAIIIMGWEPHNLVSYNLYLVMLSDNRPPGTWNGQATVVCLMDTV
jgi:hypothetical protein